MKPLLAVFPAPECPFRAPETQVLLRGAAKAAVGDVGRQEPAAVGHVRDKALAW